MSKLRKVRDAEEAAELLAAASQSGHGRADWARANGIDPRSLNAWRVNLARGRTGGSKLRLVELVTSRAARVAGCRVRLGEFTVEVDAVFDEDVLVRVLRAVAAC